MLLLALGIAHGAPALETARELAASGATRLALARVEQRQPREAGMPRWSEWEALRLSLLVRLGRNEDALKRAAALPLNLPPAALRPCLLEAARAALAAGRGALARGYAARVLWELEARPEEARAARLLVIESYLSERQGEAAFRAMLRFEQDYRPLARAIAERFVEGLIGIGMEKEAVNWLAGLEDASALKLRLQLRTGLIGPDAAVARAREQLAKGGGAGYWHVVADAAARQGNGELRIESLEQLLNQDGQSVARAPATELWRAYSAEAQAAANRNRLLTGDDTAWLDFAARRLGSAPPQARALYGHLARNGAARETRLGAQLQLAFSLHESGLNHTALRLFGDDSAGRTETLDSQARYLLGRIAETRNAAALAARFWQGLAAPPDVAAEEWQVRVAAVQWRAGMMDEAAGAVRALAKAGKPLPGPAAGRAVALAGEMRDAGKPELAQELLSALLPLAGGENARGILYALGGLAEGAAQHAQAADYYLRAALQSDAQAPDALALRARLAAGINLARAGFKEDARAQFQWLLGHAKDPAQREAARRELSRL